MCTGMETRGMSRHIVDLGVECKVCGERESLRLAPQASIWIAEGLIYLVGWAGEKTTFLEHNFIKKNFFFIFIGV